MNGETSMGDLSLFGHLLFYIASAYGITALTLCALACAIAWDWRVLCQKRALMQNDLTHNEDQS